MPDFIPETVEATHTTTVTIPRSMVNWIVQNDMTYSGAFKQGIKALQEKRTLNEQLENMKGLAKRQYEQQQQKIMQLQARLIELGQKVDA